MITRRAALTAAAAAPLLAAASARADAKGEGDLLHDGVRLEQLSALVFAAADSVEIKQLAAHETEQADALAAALDALGRKRPPAPKILDDELKAFDLDDPNLTPDELALAVEERTLAHHHDAIGRFEEVRLLQLTATIMAAQGRHLVVLRRAVDRDPLPEPVVTGRP